MTRIQFAHETWRTPNPTRTGLSTRNSAGRSLLAIGIAAALIVLNGTAVCTAASGPGIGIKVGAQTIEDPVDRDKTTRPRIELEVASPLLWDEHVDFALAFGGSFLGSYSETYTDTVDGTFIDDLYTDRLWLFDIRLAARLYPLGDSSRIRPYVGAGVGYFWFHDSWENEYSDTIDDPDFPGSFITVHDKAEGEETLAQGFFPFVVAGLTLPLGSHAEILFEFQYDIDKKGSGYDLSGPIYMFGARIRF